MARNAKGQFVKPLDQQIAELKANNPDAVTAMVERINLALKKRADFELSKKPNGTHIELRRVAGKFADSRGIAAFLHCIDADPDLMFNRVRKDGTRSNLKGLQKVRKLYEFIVGDTGAVETVTCALFASTIIAARMGVNWVSSAEQEFILSSEKVKSLPAKVRDAIYAYQHKHMTLEGDSRSQSCQFRTTFSNLGAYYFAREEFDESDYSLGISINLKSPIVQFLSDAWELNRYS